VDTEEMVALATEFAELAVDIGSGGSEHGRWQRIGQLAVAHVPGCTWASISDLHAGKGRSFGASDPVAAYLDGLQYELGEGPCVQSATVGASVLCADLQTEQRWTRFVGRARAESPLRSALAIRLPGRDAAAMNFYADQVAAFDDAAIAAGSILAAHAAGLLVVREATEHSSNLEQAVASNRQIGMAIGVLMAHHRITQEDAFTLLRVASQRLHRKLREVALEVTETGTLPDLPGHSTLSPPTGRSAPGVGGNGTA
jgi:hypothetical protein